MEIKRGNVYYKVNYKDIIKYEYFDKYPMNSCQDYHILINRTYQQPERFYKNELELLIERNIRTYEEAKAIFVADLRELANNYEQRN